MHGNDVVGKFDADDWSVSGVLNRASMYSIFRLICFDFAYVKNRSYVSKEDNIF